MEKATAKEHILGIASKMSKTMARIDPNKTDAEHFETAYDFVLCRFALWKQKASLLDTILKEEKKNGQPKPVESDYGEAEEQGETGKEGDKA